jgi:hypothetical protein
VQLEKTSVVDCYWFSFVPVGRPDIAICLCISGMTKDKKKIFKKFIYHTRVSKLVPNRLQVVYKMYMGRMGYGYGICFQITYCATARTTHIHACWRVSELEMLSGAGQ